MTAMHPWSPPSPQKPPVLRLPSAAARRAVRSRSRGDAGNVPTWLPLLGSFAIAGGLLALVVILAAFGPSADVGSDGTSRTPSPSSPAAQ